MRALMLALVAAAMMTGSAARAAWLEASSEHFVIYADQSQEDLEEFSGQLERFHHAMTFLLSTKIDPPSPSNRVTVYIVRDDMEVRRIMDARGSSVFAYYVPSAGASFAVVPRVKTSNSALDMPMLSLLHEYAHHFLISANSFAWPRWFSEGAAEFFSSAQFRKNGNVAIGMPAMHRARELEIDDVRVEQLLDPDHNRANRGAALYGKSWLLYHYLTFNEERGGQLSTYLTLLRQGKGSAEAAETAFGNLAALERELVRYAVARRMTGFEVPAQKLTPGPVHIRQLRAGEAAGMPLRIRLKNHRGSEAPTELLAQIRELSARHPGEAAAFALLAEAEFKSANDAEAIAAADASLALDPKNVDAHLHKGFALFRQAEKATDARAAYTQARRPFLELNKLENNHPLPLAYFYRSYVEQGLVPTQNAIEGLKHAVTLAPFDRDLRMALVRQQMQDKQFANAQANLAPIAFAPHGGKTAEAATKLLDVLRAHDPAMELDVNAVMSEIYASDAADTDSEDGAGEEGM